MGSLARRALDVGGACATLAALLLALAGCEDHLGASPGGADRCNLTRWTRPALNVEAASGGLSSLEQMVWSGSAGGHGHRAVSVRASFVGSEGHWESGAEGYRPYTAEMALVELKRPGAKNRCIGVTPPEEASRAGELRIFQVPTAPSRCPTAHASGKVSGDGVEVLRLERAGHGGCEGAEDAAAEQAAVRYQESPMAASVMAV